MLAQSSLDHDASFATGGGKVLSSRYSGISVIAGHVAGDIHQSERYRSRTGPVASFVDVLGRPSANAGSDLVLECSNPLGEIVFLDGRASTDPDGFEDIVEYEWSQNGVILGDEAEVEITLGLGAHEILLRVTDALGLLSQDTVLITIEDSTPPSLTLVGSDHIVIRQGVQVYQELGADAEDLCDTEVEVFINGDSVDSTQLGRYVLTYYALDDSGNVAPSLTRIVDVVAGDEIAVELRNSAGALIDHSQATIAYQPNSSGEYVPFGTGQMSDSGRTTIVFEPGRHRFQLTYQGATQTIRQRVDQNPVIEFQTVLAVVELQDSQGIRIIDSTEPVEWKPGDQGEFVPFGDGSLEQTGIESLEVLPVKHAFGLTYRGATQVLRSNVGQVPFVIFQTTPTIIEFRDSDGALIVDGAASVDYQPGSSGDYTAFANGVFDATGVVEWETLPLKHRFRINYRRADQTLQQDVVENATVVFQTVAAIVELRDSLGDLIAGSTGPLLWQPGNTGDFEPFGDGSLEEGGVETMEVLSVRHRFRVTYGNATHTISLDLGDQSLVLFQTVLARVELRTSAGTLIENSGALVTWRPAGFEAYVPFGSGDLGALGFSELEVLPMNHRFRMEFAGSTQGLQQHVGEIAVVLFQTSGSGEDPGASIRLLDSQGSLILDSGATVEYQPNSSGDYLPFGDGLLDANGNESMDVLPKIHRFRLTYRGAKQTIRQNLAENPIVVFQTTAVSLELRDSLGDLILDSGASISYQPGSAGDYVPFGDGVLDGSEAEVEELLPVKHRFRLEYQGAEKTIQQDTSDNASVVFRTVQAVVELRDSLGNLIINSGALIEYKQAGSGDYVPFGEGLVDAQGKQLMEILPRTHWFRLSYQGASRVIRQDVGEDPVIVFQTVPVSVELRDSLGELLSDEQTTLDYQAGSSGDYVPFGTGQLIGGVAGPIELLGLKHRFQVGYLGATQRIQQDVAVNPIVVFQTVLGIVELRDSQGSLIEESSALIAWQPGITGETLSFGDGILDDGGVEGLEMLGVKHRFGLVYDMAIQTVVQDFGIDATLTFQTVLATVELRDSTGALIEDSQATVAWKPQRAAAFQDFSSGALSVDGTGMQEVLPGKHRFQLGYADAIQTIQQDVVENGLVLFQTSGSVDGLGVLIELRDSLGNLIPNSGATIEYQPNSSGDYTSFGDGLLDLAGTESMEVLPQRSRFRLTYQGATQTIRQHVGDDPVVVFQTVPVVVALLDSGGDFILDAVGAIEYQPGRSGDYLPFDSGELESGIAGPLELLGVKHRFRLTYDGISKTLTGDMGEEALVLFQTVVISVELRDDLGELVLNSDALVFWKPAGGSGFEEFGSGLLGDDGTIQHEALAANHRFRMIYEGETETKVQNISKDPVVVFAPESGLVPASIDRMIGGSVEIIVEGGEVSLRIQGSPFAFARLEWSMDLEEWIPVQSFQFSRSGEQLFVDSESTKSAQGFYRLIVEEVAQPSPPASSFVGE